MDTDLLDVEIDKPKPLYKGLASFGERAGAFVIDNILLSILGYMIAGAFGISFMDLVDATKNGSDPFVIFGINFVWASVLSLIFDWFYFVQQEIGEHQASLGKRAMGLIVTDMNGQRLNSLQASTRFFTKQIYNIAPLLFVFLSADIISTLFFMSVLGYMIQPFTKQKQTLHDMMAKTLVYRK